MRICWPLLLLTWFTVHTTCVVVHLGGAQVDITREELSAVSNAIASWIGFKKNNNMPSAPNGKPLLDIRHSYKHFVHKRIIDRGLLEHFVERNSCRETSYRSYQGAMTQQLWDCLTRGKPGFSTDLPELISHLEWMCQQLELALKDLHILI